MKKRKKVGIIIVGIVGVVVLITIINFLPTFRLRVSGMKVLEGDWVNIYYEDEYDAAADVLKLAENEAGDLSIKLGFEDVKNINIYIYDNQTVMQTKKYGYIAKLLHLEWYIGDNRGTSVLLTSPANPGNKHTYDTVKDAVLHEMVHAYITLKNPEIKLWLTEGIALYLSNGEQFHRKTLKDMKIPSFADTKTPNPVKFSNMGGYTFAHTYIEYIDRTYGWNKVMELIVTEDYNKVFGKSQMNLYDEWVDYLYNYKW